MNANLEDPIRNWIRPKPSISIIHAPFANLPKKYQVSSWDAKILLSIKYLGIKLPQTLLFVEYLVVPLTPYDLHTSCYNENTFLSLLTLEGIILMYLA